MSPEVPTPEVPAVPAPSEAPVEAEAPVVPEVAADEAPAAPASEEAQSAERLIGPPPGMTEQDVAQNAEQIRLAAQVEANANSMVNRVSPSTVNTPPVPPAPLPSFHTAEELAAPTAEAPAAPEAPAPTEPTTPETQA